jgi:hypothetical protein
MRFHYSYFLFFLFSLLFISGCNKEDEENDINSALTPARNISGTWKTSFAAKVFISTDYCTNDLQVVGNEDWMVNWVISEINGRDDSVNVVMTYNRSNFQVTNSECSGGTGYIPEPSPMYLTAKISSALFKLYYGDEKIGDFGFTTDLMQGTFDFQWCMIFCQRMHTETNQLKLIRQK